MTCQVLNIPHHRCERCEHIWQQLERLERAASDYWSRKPLPRVNILLSEKDASFIENVDTMRRMIYHHIHDCGGTRRRMR